LYFRVHDITAACAKVTELGGKAALPAQSSTGLSCRVCDDQGLTFSLWQPTGGD
ncbi:MAG: bleomycin resistance protein, partial [Brevundimonas sp.]